MKQIEFYRAIKQHCIDEKVNCEKCCLRLYCYTPPCEKTDSMMNKVIDFLAEKNNHKEDYNHSDHYTYTDLACPVELDMNNALGYEHR